MAEEMNEWLRAVRPPTAADDGWVESDQAADVLAGVHARLDRRVRRPRVRPRVWLPVSVIGAAAAIVVVVTTTSSPAPDPVVATPGDHLPAIVVRPVAQSLSPYASCGDLLDGLRTHAAAHVTQYGFPNAYANVSPYLSEAAGALSVREGLDSSAPATSTTNVQEAGVDEPDVTKTGDGRVVSVIDGVLRVQDASSGQVTGTLDLSVYDGYQSAQLLTAGDTAIVLLDTATVYPANPFASYPRPVGSATPHSTALFVSLSGTPTITGSLRASGSYLDARMVGSTARIVVTSQPQITLPSSGSTPSKRLAENKATIAKAPLSAWLPTYTVTDGTHTVQNSVSCTDISHPSDYTADSMVTVYTVDTSAPTANPQPVSVAADGNTVYATATSLYVASNPRGCCVAPTGKAVTELHRFDISGTGKPSYLGSGSVSGALINQFSLSDYNGDLRVATTDGLSSAVTVLDDETLTVVGRVSGIDKGEQLYAARFVGPLGFLVTFLQTDPLVVVDLRTPSAPKVAGTLEVPGYSTYLQDAGDGRVLGVGVQTSSGALQVSLFDVRSPAAPKRSGNLVIPGSWGYNGLDPHTVLYWSSSGLVAVPLQSASGNYTGHVLVARITGNALTKVGEIANPVGSAHDDGLGIQRTLVVDGNLWTISSGGVRISDPNTLAQEQWIAF